MNGLVTFPTAKPTPSRSQTSQPPSTIRQPGPITAPCQYRLCGCRLLPRRRSSYSQVKNAPFGHFREQEFDFYFQDNFRVNKSLTINAGLRWEMHPAPHTKDGIGVTFDMAHNALVLPNPLDFYVEKGYTTPAILTNLQNLGVKFMTPEQAKLPLAGIYDSNDNFMPRLGFPIRHESEMGTVIRGGFGGYIYPVPTGIHEGCRYRSPFLASYRAATRTQASRPTACPTIFLRTH